MKKVLAERLGDRVRLDCAANLSQIKTNIESKSVNAGISVIVELDEAKIGGGLFTKPVDCIAVYNAAHKSTYYCMILAQEYQGNIPFLCSYTSGNSSNYTKQVAAENLSGLSKAIFRPSAKKQNEESWYYETMWNIIAEAIGEVADLTE